MDAQSTYGPSVLFCTFYCVANYHFALWKIGRRIYLHTALTVYVGSLSSSFIGWHFRSILLADVDEIACVVFRRILSNDLKISWFFITAGFVWEDMVGWWSYWPMQISRVLQASYLFIIEFVQTCTATCRTNRIKEIMKIRVIRVGILLNKFCTAKWSFWFFLCIILWRFKLYENRKKMLLQSYQSFLKSALNLKLSSLLLNSKKVLGEIRILYYQCIFIMYYSLLTDTIVSCRDGKRIYCNTCTIYASSL